MEKQWELSEIDEKLSRYVAHFSHALSLSPQFVRLLLRRLYKQDKQLFTSENEEKIFSKFDFFLNPSLKKLLFPSFLPNIEKASALLVEAVQNKDKILIWGDYDVDGITSTALCTEFFNAHNYPVHTHIPCREEGYGINLQKLKSFIDEGVNVIITVDCGIADIDAIDYATSMGVKIIVTDHHIPQENVPNAYAIVNPYFVEDNTDFSKKDILLAGVGVAFFFLCQVNNDFSRIFCTKCDMREFLDLVALGTIADMMPLVGQNRILVKNGLLKIDEAKRIGIRALKEACGYMPYDRLSAGQISFGLAPRINAAGRMDNPRTALDLLLCKNAQDAAKLATKLDIWNNLRKKEEEEILAQAIEQAEKFVNDPTLVLVNEHWNQGIIGIVASRIVERFHKPTFILTKEQGGDNYKGSGRSIRKFHLYNALIANSKDLITFGGHEYAAGLKVTSDCIDTFRNSLNSYYKTLHGDEFFSPTLAAEEEVHFNQVSEYAFLKEMELLEPYGVGNAEPIYISKNVEIVKVEPFGYADKHLKLELYDVQSGQKLHSKLWNAQDFPHKAGTHVDIAYNIEIAVFNNVSHINMKLKDIRKSIQ